MLHSCIIKFIMLRISVPLKQVVTRKGAGQTSQYFPSNNVRPYSSQQLRFYQLSFLPYEVYTRRQIAINIIQVLHVDCESFLNRKRKVPKSKVAAIVHLQAKLYCQIFYICKEALACSRYGCNAALEFPTQNNCYT